MSDSPPSFENMSPPRDQPSFSPSGRYPNNYPQKSGDENDHARYPNNGDYHQPPQSAMPMRMPIPEKFGFEHAWNVQHPYAISKKGMSDLPSFN